MDTLRLIIPLEKIQKLTTAEKRSTAAALNASKNVIGCITDYLEYEVNQLDKTLADPEELYQSKTSDTYVAFKLAERATLIKLLSLLTKEVTILDGDQPKDI